MHNKAVPYQRGTTVEKGDTVKLFRGDKYDYLSYLGAARINGGFTILGTCSCIQQHQLRGPVRQHAEGVAAVGGWWRRY